MSLLMDIQTNRCWARVDFLATGEIVLHIPEECELPIRVLVCRGGRSTEYEPKSSEKPNNCETCKWGERYRQGYDITMMDDECGGCCSWNSKWTPKDEPHIVGKHADVIIIDEPQTCSVNGRPYSECVDCEYFKCMADEPQTDCPWK